eukprot:gene2284-2969_t
MSDAEMELKAYTSTDADLTQNLNELSVALNIQAAKLQVEQYSVVCDIKSRVADVGGDAKKLHDLAESFGAD